MNKILALNKNREMTYCTTSKENRGKGRCNHIFHQNENESAKEFTKRIEEEQKIENLTIEEKIKMIKNGENLEKFINDCDYMIRKEVAKQEYGLDKLIDDKDEYVRVEVVRQKYCLYILINDKSEYVRSEVADQGYGLDILINDESYFVRCAVANQGYGLDKLANDKNKNVRETAIKIKNKEI